MSIIDHDSTNGRKGEKVVVLQKYMLHSIGHFNTISIAHQISRYRTKSYFTQAWIDFRGWIKFGFPRLAGNSNGAGVPLNNEKQ